TVISIGRGLNGLVDKADILINSSGNVFCTNGTLTTTAVNNGTFAMTTGALSTTSINNSGTSTLTGAVSCGAITSTGNFSNGTNSMTTGSLSCSSLYGSSSGSFLTPSIQIGATSDGIFRSTYLAAPTLSLANGGNQVDFVKSGAVTRLLAQGP